MQVREMQLDDFEAIYALGAEMHEESSFADTEFSSHKVHQLLHKVLDDQNKVCFVATYENEIVGAYGAYVGEYYFSFDKAVFDYLLYVKPNRRGSFAAVRLIETMKAWAESFGVHEMRINVGAQIRTQEVERFFERAGWDYCGGNFRLRLE